eukprot:6874814-Prorocentrum_lima.AAC.1
MYWFEPPKGLVECGNCGKTYFDHSPLEVLAEKWGSGTFYCNSCELRYLQREWSLYANKEKSSYLEGLDFLDSWSEKI